MVAERHQRAARQRQQAVGGRQRPRRRAQFDAAIVLAASPAGRQPTANPVKPAEQFGLDRNGHFGGGGGGGGATVGRQAFTQWKQRSTAGVSRWLYIGQLATSTGYVIYSVMLDNIGLTTYGVALAVGSNATVGPSCSFQIQRSL